ncbi:MAG: DUF1549 domain-containing protein [Chthonomonadaceae bacterium]|nr:DUF1549 domain-containing protein [Chthonomonadaceae bacterium]
MRNRLPALFFCFLVCAVPALAQKAKKPLASSSKAKISAPNASPKVKTPMPELAPVSFVRDVAPILTRRGCNTGACHGAQFGKGGFKLSLAGFDPDLDHVNLVKQMRGRRVTLAEPAQSLFLTKPLMTVPHGGGIRFTPKDADYAVLLRWLKEGAKGPDATEPPLLSISVLPVERVVPRVSPAYPLKVTALYADNSTRDVTSHARINSLNDGIASATPEGVVKSNNYGQTSIMIRYGGFAAVSAVVVPYPSKSNGNATKTKPTKGKAKAKPPLSSSSSVLSSHPIDLLVARKLTQLNLTPSSVCDDATFLRRVSLDLTGTLPALEETRAFLKDKSPDKRAKRIDFLLNRPEYADYWTLKWSDLLRVRRDSLGAKGMWSFGNWIHTQVTQNVPLDKFVRDLITAKGSAFTNGPANLYRIAREPQDLTELTSQVFLGVRMQCAKCHQHPFEKWSQRDYYQYAAFFARVRTKDSKDFGLFGQEQIVRINDDGDVRHPKTNEVMTPTPLGTKLALLKPKVKEIRDATPAKTSAVPVVPAVVANPVNPDASGDRRTLLADWLTSKENRLFARNFANRYWGYLFGKGIVNPIDDMRVTNPASNPALLDYLADTLIKNNYDVKALLRHICLSQTYQRSSEVTGNNGADEAFFTHYLPKRLPAESLLDAIDSVCGTREKYNDLPLGTHAIQLPDPQVYNEFLDTFGRPIRQNSCECERISEVNLSQTLRMLNGDTVNNKIRDDKGKLNKNLNAKRLPSLILDEMYLSAFGRLPTLREKRIALGVIAFAPEPRQVYEDVLLTLLNSKEFLFVR